MAFDARQYLKLLEPPTYIDSDPTTGEEVRFVGQLIPFDEALPVVARLYDFEKRIKAGSEDDQISAYRALEQELRAIVGDTVRAIKMPDEAVSYITRLPHAAIMLVLADFFTCLQGIPQTK